MKHKIALIASALFMALTITACGASESASAPSVAENDKTMHYNTYKDITTEGYDEYS